MKLLQDLEEKLSKKFDGSKKLNHYTDILHQYNGTDWMNFIKQDFEGKYFKNIVFRNDKFDIYVITWKPNIISGFHDHGENGCLFKILQGSLREDLYINKSIKTILCKENQIHYIDNEIGLHSIKNTNNNYTYSLHIYSPPNYKCNFYPIS